MDIKCRIPDKQNNHKIMQSRLSPLLHQSPICSIVRMSHHSIPRLSVPTRPSILVSLHQALRCHKFLAILAIVLQAEPSSSRRPCASSTSRILSVVLPVSRFLLATATVSPKPSRPSVEQSRMLPLSPHKRVVLTRNPKCSRIARKCKSSSARRTHRVILRHPTQLCLLSRMMSLGIRPPPCARAVPISGSPAQSLSEKSFNSSSGGSLLSAPASRLRLSSSASIVSLCAVLPSIQWWEPSNENPNC